MFMATRERCDSQGLAAMIAWFASCEVAAWRFIALKLGYLISYRTSVREFPLATIAPGLGRPICTWSAGKWEHRGPLAAGLRGTSQPLLKTHAVGQQADRSISSCVPLHGAIAA